MNDRFGLLNRYTDISVEQWFILVPMVHSAFQFDQLYKDDLQGRAGSQGYFLAYSHVPCHPSEFHSITSIMGCSDLQ